MVTKRQIEVDDLVRETPSQFLVHSRVYTDPEIFELEMEKIFHKAWNYIAHESELPDGGDYKATFIGRHPVIVARSSDDGQIRVFLNRCRHRGATVCQQEYGNANYFRCAYHGWVYNNSGELAGVPFEEGYGSDFDKAKTGLVEAPRVGSYQGLIFASLSPEGPSLEAHLGNAKLALDFIFGKQGQLYLGKGRHKFGYNGNWKLQMENTVDGYHVGVLHKAYFEIIARRMGRAPVDMSQDNGRTRDLGNGHNTLADDPFDPGYQIGPMGLNFNVGIFPNIDILALETMLPTQIRVIRPISVNRTEVTLYPLLKKGAAPEVNFDRLRRYEEFYGPGGFASPDDWEVFNRIQTGIQADAIAGSEWVLHRRGIDWEEVDQERGIRTNRGRYGEASQRAIYRHWKQVMAE